MCGPCAADESVARRFIRACGTSATRHRIAGIINQNPRAPSLSAPRTRDDDYVTPRGGGGAAPRRPSRVSFKRNDDPDASSLYK
jgi:hypothetical protein